MCEQSEREDEKGKEAEWTEDLEGFPSQCPFTGNPGLHVGDDIVTPLDFFHLTWTKELVKFIKKETNCYAQEQIAQRQPLSPNSRFQKWKPVKVSELYKFFTILIHMGLMKLPFLFDYWAKLDVVKCDFAGSLLSRDRFQIILSCLHLCNNENYIRPGQQGNDPLFKVRYLYDHLRTLYPPLYTPTSDICIDEAICPWKGNIRYRVYMKDKPHKWGIKFYELCESDSGYVYNFEIYCGDPQLSNRPVEVCKRLMENLLNKGYTLFTDNYYTCPELSFALARQHTMTVGTVRSNRVGMPQDLSAARLETGQFIYRRKGPLAALRWKDKKDVHMLTTVHDPQEKKSVTTRSGTKDKPVYVQSYIQHMAGVDHSHQLLSYVPLRRRTSKCWKKIFLHMFTLNLIQCSILHKKRRMNRLSTIPLPEYLKQLGQALAADFAKKSQEAPSSSSCPGTPTTAATSFSRITEKHFPYPLPATASRQKARRDCKDCSDRKRKADQLAGAPKTF